MFYLKKLYVWFTGQNYRLLEIEDKIDNAVRSATNAFRTSSKRVIQKTAEASGGLIGNKIANRITKVSKNSQQNNLKTIKKQQEKEILKKDTNLQKRDKKVLMNYD